MTTYYANAIRRQTRDFVVRLRSVISGSGIPGCEKVVDQLDGETAEHVCAEVCSMLGLDYDPPPDVPRRKSDGRPSPWARRGGVRGKVALTERPARQVVTDDPPTTLTSTAGDETIWIRPRAKKRGDGV